MSVPKVMALTADYTGCTLIRVFQPFSYLARQGYPCYVGEAGTEESNAHIESMDAIVLPRRAWKPGYESMALEWREQLHANGVALIAEWDDDTFSPAVLGHFRQSGRQATSTDDELEAERQARIFALRLADGVTVSTEYLAGVVRGFTDKPIVVVPNAIDLDWWRAVLAASKRHVPSPSIGWAGGGRPDGDAEQMAMAWGRIAKLHPDVTFVLGGFYPVVIDRYVPNERVVRIPYLPLESYPVVYQEMDIGCCPLADTHFNRSRSVLKALECAATGIPVVASPTVYGDLIDHGKTGYLAQTADQWETALDALIRSRQRRQAMSRRLLRIVEREHSLKTQAITWPIAWAEIIRQTQARWVAEGRARYLEVS